jgi:hypothetical protein
VDRRRFARSSRPGRNSYVLVSLANHNTSGILPLYEGVWPHQSEIVSLLISRGADPKLTEEPCGTTALEVAIQDGHIEIAYCIR